jgi:tetratricopeptide (TPR) repeat protein
MTRAVLLLSAAVLLAGAACSSAPPPKEEIFEKRNQAARYLEFGNRYFRDAMFDQALRFYDLAREYYASLDDREGQTVSLNSIGKVRFLAGDPDGAMEEYRKALALAESTDRPDLLLQTSNNIGEVHIRRGENDEAAELFRKTLDRHEFRAAGSLELAVLYHNRGVVLRNLGDDEAALGEAEKAAAMNREAKRFEELASNHYLMSSVHLKREDHSEALRHAEIALEYDKKMENSLGIAQDLAAVGTIYEKTGKMEEAHDMYTRAFLVYRSLRYLPGMSLSLEALEAAAEKLDRKEDAKRYREARELLLSQSPR